MDKIFVGYPGSMDGDMVGGVAAIPVGFEQDATNAKLYTDRYEVFVNGDKVGDKVQRTQVEDAQYLQSYLKDNGFEGFDYEVVGDHIEISAQEDAKQMKEILSSYLSIT